MNFVFVYCSRGPQLLNHVDIPGQFFLPLNTVITSVFSSAVGKYQGDGEVENPCISPARALEAGAEWGGLLFRSVRL
jgi:hypothetical protein